MPKEAKATNIETANRIFTIQGWIIQSVPDYLILQNCKSQWNLGLRQSKRLLAKAYKIWYEEETKDKEQKRVMKIAELKQLIRSLKENYKGTPQGIMAVNSVQKEINKLEDIYPAKTHIHKGDNEAPINHKVEISIISTRKRIATSEEEVDV